MIMNCKACGIKIRQDSNFCYKCGHPVNEEVSTNFHSDKLEEEKYKKLSDHLYTLLVDYKSAGNRTAIKNEIIEHIETICTDQVNAVNLLNYLHFNYSMDLIEYVKGLSNSYDTIRELLFRFIQLKIIEGEYPHKKLPLDHKTLEKTKIVSTKKPPKKIYRTKNTSNSFNSGLIIFVIIVAVVLGVYYLKTESGSSGGASGSKSNGTCTQYITTQPYYAAYSKEDLDLMMDYSMNNEVGLINDMLYTGRIIQLPVGTDVYLVKAKFGTVQIRLKGKHTTLWTVTEAIEMNCD